jgi:hypothetical protein
VWQERFDRIKRWYFQSKYKRIYAQYNLSLYRDLLYSIDKDPHLNWRPFFTQDQELTEHKWVYVRHDIDTEMCIKMLPNMIEIDRSFNVVPGVFFIVNNEAYQIEQCRNIARDLKDKGCVVGLHSTCYLKDDYLTEFRREIDIFESVIGYRPDTFNVHGFGNHRLEARLAFYKDISRCYSDFGFEYSDCWSEMREYKYTIEDCHWCHSLAKRYVKDDIKYPQRYLKTGNNLLMTHPCYWIE